MSSPASIAGHPMHPMFVAFPIGLWVFSLACDIVYVITGDPTWTTVALYTLGGGIIGALLAAIPGFIDYFSMSSSEAQAKATWHMAINLIIVVIMAIGFFMRVNHANVLGMPFILSIVGVLLLTVSGWLGGSLVYLHGMAVDKKVCEDKNRPQAGAHA